MSDMPKSVTIVEPTVRGDIGGRLIMSDGVIATITAYAAAQVPGIVSIGRSGLNLALDGKTILQTGPGKGVEVEVGETQAAMDIEVTIEFGIDMVKVARDLRNKVAEAVRRMCGRDVIEVNINVIGIQMPDTQIRTTRVQ